MTDATLVMTKLDAVNQMLSSIGQSPINTLSGTLPKDATKAILSLDTVQREVLNAGWSFNTDNEYELTPDGNDNILIPSNAMFVDPTYGSKDYVMRWESGTAKLYNRDDHTFVIIEPVKCDIIWAYAFENVPQHARNYVYTRAARIFQTQIVGSQILFQYTAQIEADAWALFKRMEKRSKRYNINAYDPTVHRAFNPPRY